MPHKYFADQFDDEEVLFIFRKHPIVMRKGVLLAAAGTLVGPLYTLVLAYTRPSHIPSMTFFFLSILVGLAAGLLLMIPKWVSWYFSVYIVTDQRFIQINQTGFFHKSVVDMALGQIQMVNYEVAGLSQTLFGFGTIIMQTIVGDLVIHEVHHPATIQKKLLEVLRVDGNLPPTTEVQQTENDDDEIVYEEEN
jgi:uncharacterized integral membrane protein